MYLFIFIFMCARLPKNTPKLSLFSDHKNPVTDDEDVLQSRVEGVSHGVLDVHHFLKRQG